MTALYIGRFQPFHNGHLSAIEYMMNKGASPIIIGIGSAQLAGDEKNPFTYEQRRAMIDHVLEPIPNLTYEIVAIPDINDAEHWVEHVKGIAPEFDAVYTGNDYVRELFEKANDTVEDIPQLEGVSATRVRELIKKNDPTWITLVPTAVSAHVDTNIF